MSDVNDIFGADRCAKCGKYAEITIPVRSKIEILKLKPSGGGDENKDTFPWCVNCVRELLHGERA